MANIREKKKADTRQKIVTAAKELFNEIGFDAATIEKIAGKAYIGVGTLYNYYPSKVDILLDFIEEGLPEIYDVVDATDITILESKVPSVAPFISIFMNSRKLSLWREIFAAAFTKNKETFSKLEVFDTDKVIERYQNYVENWKKKGVIYPHIDALSVAKTMYYLMVFSLMRYIPDTDISGDILAQKAIEQVDGILKMITIGR